MATITALTGGGGDDYRLTGGGGGDDRLTGGGGGGGDSTKRRPPPPPRPDLPDDGSRREEDALAGPHPHVVTVEEVRSIDPDTGEVQDKPLLETVRVTQRGAQDTQNQQVDAGSVRLTSAGGNVQARLDLEPGVPSPDVETPRGQRILNTVDLRTGEVVETGIPESGPAQQAPADLDTPADSLDPLSGDPAPLSKKERVRQALLAGRRDAGIIGQGLGRGAANVRLGAAGAVGYAATQLEAQKERNLQAAANERRRLKEEKQNAERLHAEIMELQEAKKAEDNRQKSLGTSGRLGEKARRVQAAIGGQEQVPSEQRNLGAEIKAKQKETEKAAQNYRPAKGAKGTPKNPYQAALEAMAKMGGGKESAGRLPRAVARGPARRAPAGPARTASRPSPWSSAPRGRSRPSSKRRPPAGAAPGPAACSDPHKCERDRGKPLTRAIYIE